MDGMVLAKYPCNVVLERCPLKGDLALGRHGGTTGRMVGIDLAQSVYPGPPGWPIEKDLLGFCVGDVCAHADVVPLTCKPVPIVGVQVTFHLNPDDGQGYLRLWSLDGELPAGWSHPDPEAILWLDAWEWNGMP